MSWTMRLLGEQMLTQQLETTQHLQLVCRWKQKTPTFFSCMTAAASTRRHVDSSFYSILSLLEAIYYIFPLLSWLIMFELCASRQWLLRCVGRFFLRSTYDVNKRWWNWLSTEFERMKMLCRWQPYESSVALEVVMIHSLRWMIKSNLLPCALDTNGAWC